MRREFLIIIGLALVAVVISVFVLLQGSNKLSDWLLGQATVQDGQFSGAAVVVPFTEIARGDESSVTTRANYLITSASQLSELWKMINVAKQAPTVDFEHNDVIAVFTGTRGSGGYTIAVSKIEDSAIRNVTVTLMQPGSGCALTEALTAPYQVAVVAKTKLSLNHKDDVLTVNCLK